MSISTLEAQCALRRFSPPVHSFVKKSFDPGSARDAGDYRAFFKDCQGMEKTLVYGGKSVFTRFEKFYREIADLEETQQQILKSPESEGNTRLYEVLQNEIDTATARLKTKIKLDFQNFLDQQLGPERAHLAPEILFRFSQQPLTRIMHEVGEHTKRRYQKNFMGTQPEKRRCELIISQNAPVQVVATTQTVFDQCLPSGKMEAFSLRKPLQLSARAVYTIDSNAETNAECQFSLKEKTQSPASTSFFGGLWGVSWVKKAVHRVFEKLLAPVSVHSF